MSLLMSSSTHMMLCPGVWDVYECVIMEQQSYALGKKKVITRNVSVWHRCPRPGPSSPTSRYFAKNEVEKRAITLIIIGRFYPKSNLTIFYDYIPGYKIWIQYTYQSFLKQEKCLTHYGRVFQKINEKVNLGRHNARRPWHRYFKGQIYEKSVQNSTLATQAFGFRYLTKKVSIVSLIQGMPTGPYLCQILSKYFKPFRSYEVHKNLALKFIRES